VGAEVEVEAEEAADAEDVVFLTEFGAGALVSLGLEDMDEEAE
jgi:hypothetical protein